MRDLKNMTSSLGKPGVHLVSIDAPTRSHFGGNPNLPESIQWPMWQDRKLGFLARISLPELQRTHKIDWLPNHGALLFFYDIEKQPWGIYPEDRGSFAVFHVPDLEAPIADTTASSNDHELKHINISFQLIQTLPWTDQPEIRALKLSDPEERAYFELVDDPFQGHAKHLISGFPLPAQHSDMELMCQYGSNGLSLEDSDEYEDTRNKELEAGESDWRMLLQFDSDDDLDVMWGDSGSLFFWVREQDAASGRFDNSWLVLQCY